MCAAILQSLSVLMSRRQESWLSETSPEFRGRCDEGSLYSLSVSEAPQAVRLSPLLRFIAHCTNDIKHRIAARMFSNISFQVRQTMKFIEPMVKERFAKMDELGETWEDAPVRSPVPIEICCPWSGNWKQNDMLMWLMSEAKGVEKSLEGLARRLLLLNFVAIHTTSLVRHCTA